MRRIIYRPISFFGIFVFFIGAGIFSCGDPCGPFPNKYKTIDLDVLTLAITYTDSNQTDFQLQPIDQDTLDFNQLALELLFEQESYFAAGHSKWHFDLFPILTACDPAPPITDETIDSIGITSVTDYNVNFPAGSNLVNLFDVIVTDFTQYLYRERMPLQDYLAQNPSVPNGMTLVLREAPDATNTYTFRVRYYQNGIELNDYFELVSESILVR